MTSGEKINFDTYIHTQTFSTIFSTFVTSPKAKVYMNISPILSNLTLDFTFWQILKFWHLEIRQTDLTLEQKFERM
jgi:hypothetical protein